MDHNSGIGWLFLIFCLGIFSCRQEKPVDAELMDSLVGKWALPAQSQDPRRFIEEWSRENDSTYSGNAYLYNEENGDQFNQEILRIAYRNGWWTYTAEPKGQEKAVFTLSELTPDRFLVINPAHDFPKFIEYQWLSPDTIRATIGDDSTSRGFVLVRMK
jgi:hypothetical protein